MCLVESIIIKTLCVDGPGRDNICRKKEDFLPKGGGDFASKLIVATTTTTTKPVCFLKNLVIVGGGN